MPEKRPDFDSYFMNLAIAVRERAECIGRRVGAVVAFGQRVISTGYNGTPSGMKNCTEGGCHRCRNKGQYPPGEGYDVCICVHAEQNAMATAARIGIPVLGAVVYTTMRPCFTCLKEMLQAGIQRIVYLHEWEHPVPELATQYSILESRIPSGVSQLHLDDPRKDWAMSQAPHVRDTKPSPHEPDLVPPQAKMVHPN